MKKQLYDLISGVRNRHVLGVDLLMFCFIPLVALLLRVDSPGEAGKYLFPLAIYTVASLAWKLLTFYPLGLYNRYWQFASADELSRVVAANLMSMVIGLAAFYTFLKPLNVPRPELPRSIPLIDGMLTMLLSGGFRFCLRVGFDYNEQKEGTPAKKKALIVGAGVAGSMIIKELKMNPQLAIEPVGFLDDDPYKQDVRIHGIPVIGMLKDLPTIVFENGIQEVIIAMPTATGTTVRDVVQMCKQSKVPSKTIPGIFEILGGSAKVSQIRDVQIEDLLRRGVVKTDTNGVGQLLRNARVMVTGAGGSIGSELCRQISTFAPRDLILVGHGENSIFQIASELRSIYPGHSNNIEGLRVHSIIADVRDEKRMRWVFSTYKPTVVFHAAAHKHVSLMETNIPDAISNNVLGTKRLVELSAEFDVARFVMISSDKAVNPTCMMGVTKRVAELIVHEVAERTGKSFVSVRFGNVLGSRGSVVPIFKQQIAAGGPVLITHPEVRRYFMTIPEAVQLVLEAATMGEGGEVFVLDMGEPIKIVDLARDIIRLSGFEEGRDMEIVYTGLQKGEKLTEQLFFESEKVERSDHEKILVCRKNVDLDAMPGEQPAVASFDDEAWQPRFLETKVEQLAGAAMNGANEHAMILLREIVPEFRAPDGNVHRQTKPLPDESEKFLAEMKDSLGS